MHTIPAYKNDINRKFYHRSLKDVTMGIKSKASRKSLYS